ncbi:MAG TPA: V-type ATP synthase subunit B [Tissierellia bacterium]|nr:V-type ATP synthase subunit B [Tissierellia bacterium]
MKEYRGIQSARGPLVFLEPKTGVQNGEIVELRDETGLRRARVIRLEPDHLVAQVFEGTSGIERDDVYVRYTGDHFKLELSPDILGRTFSGVGQPIDMDGSFFGEVRRDINGRPINPMSREYPRNYIHTGISAIDSLMTLIRGQKLPIFSGAGLPHREIAAQIVAQARLKDQTESFAVVFGAIGITQDDAFFFMNYFNENQVSDHLVSYFNYAQDPVSERVMTPRCALCAAEYLAFDLGMNVLVVLLDITSYCEGLREISSSREEVPSRKGFPGYLYSDLASLYERAGILADRPGSITLLPILTMPGDDITHPIPDLTGYITEGQIVLSRSLHRAGIYPPIDVLPSLSRLMKDGIGEGYTREDHADLSNQLFSAYAKVGDARNLAQVIGRDDLSPIDQTYLDFGDAFEQRFLSQSATESRSLDKSFAIGWEILKILPLSEMDRLSPERIRRFLER